MYIKGAKMITLNIKRYKKFIMIISVILILCLSIVIYKTPVNFYSLYHDKNSDNISVRLDRTAYSDFSKFELTDIQKEQIISQIIEMKYERYKKPDYYHGNRTISFAVINHDLRFQMYFNLDICKPEWSVVVLNAKGYKISKEDAIDLLHLFEQGLPLDDDNSRCK